MDSSKIIPISVGVAGLGILLFAIAQTSKNKNANVYLNHALETENLNVKEQATLLYEAMREVNFTNTEKRKAIFTALTGVTPLQFSLIVKAFGNRYYNTFTGNTSFAIWQNPVKYPLKLWLKEELSNSDYQLLKSKYPKYL
ncbi:hypothetical protein [Flavobacterium sp.]|uniref:hypothetical protein n=1 Tax=Flavobacterium sp. TaxID=239 RepID=UPI003751EEBC